MTRGFLSAVIALVLVQPAVAIQLLDVRKVWDNAPHNAFTDLVRFDDQFYLTFREASVHIVPPVGSAGGNIRVLRSADGETWSSAALLDGGANRDYRDSYLSVTPEGRLLLNSAVAPHESVLERQSLAWLSDDGSTWSSPTEVGDANYWMWQTQWHEGHAYSIGYGPTTEGESNWETRLYRSSDGVSYETIVGTLNSGGGPNETGLLFRDDGSAVALVRRDNSPNMALVGTAAGDYTNWTFKDTGVAIGGPEIIQIPDGRIVAATRLYDSGGNTGHTALSWLDPEAGTLKRFLNLPSGGDNSYPGMVWHNDQLWVSYYSSHEGKASIYLAEVAIRALGSPIEHLGSNDPLSEGWNFDSNSSNYQVNPGTDSQSFWSVAQPAGNRANYYAPLFTEDVEDPSGWTATARVKLVEGGTAPGDVTLDVKDGENLWSLHFIEGDGTTPGGLWTVDANYQLDTRLADVDPAADYHVYQMIYDPAGNGSQGLLRYYMDGNLLGTATRDDTRASGELAFRFGDARSMSSFDTSAQWAWVRFETGQHVVPEPAAVAMLAGTAVADERPAWTCLPSTASKRVCRFAWR